MFEYSLAALLMLAIIIVLDRFLLKTKLLYWRNARLLKTSMVFVVFQLALDNYFTSQGLWIFNPQSVIGIFLPFIPLENILFGTELLWLTIILYTFFMNGK